MSSLIKRAIQAGALCACLFFLGCGGKEYQYEPQNELKPGPGLFSREEGEFKLIERSYTQEEPTEEEKEQ
ncbi:MAG: hypothetical protein D6B25_15545 [Desulfobulbaceae bacterium]|mgnify:CR=1 FL=1|nr:MAG: hypothetical protein D6B25_15545 [Desulfobulbaceae bacterium]